MMAGDNDTEARLAELTELRQTDRDGYFRSGASEEYGELIARREGGATGQDARPAPKHGEAAVERTRGPGPQAEVSEAADGPALVSLDRHEARTALLADPATARLAEEWHSHGIDVPEAQRRVVLFLDGLDGEAQARVAASFDGLPAGARAAVLSELTLGAVGHIRDATPDVMAEFGAVEEGAELLLQWGDRAPQRVAVVKARMGRIRDGMEDMTSERFLDWVSALPGPSFKALLAALAR